MSDIIRTQRESSAEQEARETRRLMERSIRAGRQAEPHAAPIYTPPAKPLMGGGPAVAWVLNMPRIAR